MFWKKRVDPAVEAVPQVSPDDVERRLARAESDLDSSLEALAGILRALAKHSFPVGDDTAEAIGKRLEAWASHVLVLAPLPDEAEGGRPTRREWSKLARFVKGHRKREQEHVTASISGMRDAIVTMLQCFSATSVGQARSDRSLTTQLDRLRSVVETGSLEQLRNEAQSVSEAVRRALEEQRERTAAQTESLRQKLEALREQLDAAQRDGETDPLTKLANRRAFDAALDRTSLMASVVGRSMTLLLIDIDHFKKVNDTYGHPVGDLVLRELSNVLTRSFPRRSDVVARYGGEEFAIILTETNAKDGLRLAARFLEAARAMRVEVGERTLNVTASVGVGELADGETPAELLARTDAALYRAKRTGRDRVVVAPLGRPSEPVLLDERRPAKQRAAS